MAAAARGENSMAARGADSGPAAQRGDDLESPRTALKSGSRAIDWNTGNPRALAALLPQFSPRLVVPGSLVTDYGILPLRPSFILTVGTQRTQGNCPTLEY